MLNMKMKKVILKVLAAVLAIAMVVTVLPETSAVAAETTDGSSGDENLVLNKQAWLEDDGTYTIQLEAYARGNVSKETYKKVVPADIILVLDQSGSMHNNNYMISGIPSDTYTKVTGSLTNAEVAGGSYYYEVNGNYYLVEAEKETVGVETKWVGQDGKYYTEDQLSYSWSSSSGYTYNTAQPFVTESLKTYTRQSHSTGGATSFWYVNDKDASDSTKGRLWGELSAASAREKFINQKKTDSTTVEFHNDGIPEGSTTEIDNLYYVAAVYTAVTKEEVKTYRYTYSYTDDEGNLITIGSSEGGDSDTCTISPLYTRGTTTGYRLDALQYATKKFVANIYASAKKNNVDHRIAVVGFGSDEYTGSNSEYYYSNSELFVGATQYNYYSGGKESTYNKTGNLAANHYGKAFQSVLTDSGHKNVLASIDALAGKGATYPSIGFDMANGIFNANDNTYTMDDGKEGKRSRIIIFLTDGEPGDTSDSFNDTEASATYTQANTAKNTYGANVYTVAVLDSTPKENVDTFLKTVASSGEYTLATDTSKLEGFFDEVDQSISSTTTTVVLSKDAVLVDLWSDYFVAPEGFSAENNVTVKTAKHTGYESFAAPSETPTGVKASVTKDTDGTVSGIQVNSFNYVSDENLVKTDTSGGSVKASGNKLVVTIKGLLAKDEAAKGTYIDTNKAYSAIWDTDSDGTYGIVKEFEIPHARLDKQMAVLDYAKTAKISAYNASKVDSASDNLFSKVGENSTFLVEKYGKISITEADGLTYTPSTMQWDGYDSFYALGKDNIAGDQKTKNIWSKVTVVPANNVYYEDDFVTSDEKGTVGIVYSGTWAVEGTSSNNQETANTEIHGGWENTDLANDTTFTDGTAHVSSASGATATFTFKGKGVDIYSYTDIYSGVIRAKLYKVNEDDETSVLTKSYIIDNYAASGEYYQIPTASFMDLEYGTYKVEITVFAKDNKERARSTYYLDGIRIYNPIEEDSLVQEAYGNEAGAIFKSVREMLLDAKTLTSESTAASGVVFIDQSATENGTTTNIIGTYEEYGPKNEVYLAKNQAIAFKVSSGEEAFYSVGLKAMTGAATKATVTYGNEKTYEYDVETTADLYYQLVPNNDGLIVIKNTGDNLLSITKLKTCVENGDAVEEVDVAMLMAYVDEFDSLEVIDFEKEPEDEQVPDVEIKDDVAEKDDMQQEDTVSVLQKIVEEIFASVRSWFGR